MREGLKVSGIDAATKKKMNPENEEDPDSILNQTDTQYNTRLREAFLEWDSLNAIKDQYAKLKY